MMKRMGRYAGLIALLASFFWLSSCEDDAEPTGIKVRDPNDPVDTLDSNLGDGPIDFSMLPDTYPHLASEEQVMNWMHYNVHDPSIFDNGDFFYCYNTDVAFGHGIRAGIQIRRSKNLVEWEYVGWVLNGLPAIASAFIEDNGGTPNGNLWAPYAMRVGEEYRVYYSLASNVGRLSAIGLATSDKPYGPFTDQGIVVRSVPAGTHTNAIDPSILIDQSGKHWMFYGSSWDGIYLMELDPVTGLAMTDGDIGRRVAHRGFTGNTINGNIEGPEIIYNEEFDMYYLFIAYDWLESKYNVRVGRSTNPEGPYVDIHGVDMNQFSDNEPMILAPYKFQGHSGWQGVSHPAVFRDGEDFFIGHQGRPGVNRFYMVLHTRQIHWTEDGWPLVSPQRYADEDETAVEEGELAGTWEQIVFGYDIVPGFAEEQTSPGFQSATVIMLDAAGTIDGNADNTWSYDAPWLTFSLEGGNTYTLRVERGRDWEKEVDSTILFTGLDQDATTIWGKKIE